MNAPDTPLSTSEPAGAPHPGRARLQRDLQSADFDLALTQGLWRLVGVDWPTALFAVTAGDGGALGLRLDLTGYPGQAPAGQPWDLAAAAPLPMERWPLGATAEQTFRRDWSQHNGNAPYLACDRVPLPGHPDWPVSRPERCWNPTRTIAFYLAEISRELTHATLPSAA